MLNTIKTSIDLSSLMSEWREMLHPSNWLKDAEAGLTVALVAFPLNLSLAFAAGVEPIIGITTAIVAGVIGSLFGGQRLGITGPSVALAVVLVEIAENYDINTIWLVCLLAGLMQVISGLLGLGKLISYIPRPVIVGFASAVGILVIANILGDFIGLPTTPLAHLGHAHHLSHPLVPEIIVDLKEIYFKGFVEHSVNFAAITIGILTLFLAAFASRITKIIPGPLIAIAGATIVAWLFNIDVPRIAGSSTVTGVTLLPSIPDLPWHQAIFFFPTAFTIFLLASLESLLSASIADGMCMTTKHNPNQELLGQGLANFLVPFFGGIPVSGVIIRTTVNIRAGAITRLAGIFQAIFLSLILLSLTHIIGQIPIAALSAIVIFTGFRLIEWQTIKKIWHTSRPEGYVVLATILLSVCIDLTAGVMAGLIFACGLFIRQMSDVKVIAKSKEQFTNARPDNLPTCKFVQTYLVDGPLFFGAAERFIEDISPNYNTKILILNMRAVTAIDVTGAETLVAICEQMKRRGNRLMLAELLPQTYDVLQRSSALEVLGKENIHETYRSAVIDANRQMLETKCQGCNNPPTGPAGPKDCSLRNALLDESHPIARIMTLYPEKNEASGASKDEQDEQDALMQRLLPVDKLEDIPSRFINTPFEVLFKAHNLGQFDAANNHERAELLIGMCIDYRKSLSVPRDWAYTIRREGANMDGAEFSIAFALSTGITHMALIAHNHCGMSQASGKRQQLVDMLVNRFKWDKDEAALFFDQFAHNKEIGNEVDFVLDEAERLAALFSGLFIVPMIFRVEDDRLYLVKDWLNA